MNNKYVKLVEEVNNISFSKVVNVLKRKLPVGEENEPEYSEKVITLAKEMAYVYAWNGIGHSINDGHRIKKFGIVQGNPTKVADYNIAKKNMSDAINSDNIDDAVLATTLSSKYYDEAKERIARLINYGPETINFTFDDLLDAKQKPEVLKQHQRAIFDYYRHSK